MKTYRLSRHAVDDVRDIYRYGFRQFGLEKADEYYHRLFAQFDVIVENPLAFPLIEDLGTDVRRCVFGSHSIYFKLIDSEINILTIVRNQDLGDILS